MQILAGLVWLLELATYAVVILGALGAAALVYYLWRRFSRRGA